MNTDLTEFLRCEMDCTGNLPRAARSVVRRAVSARLVTPAGPLRVAVACDLDGAPLVLGPAGRTGQEGAVELGYDPSPAPAGLDFCSVNLHGVLAPMKEEPSLGRYIARFCNRHARPAESLRDGGLALYHLELTAAEATVNGGGSRALTSADFLLAVGEAPDHRLKEWDNLAHQNYQHPDINEQLVTALLGEFPGRWVMCGLDPEGMDFRLGDRFCRLPFPDPAYTYDDMGEAVVKLFVPEARRRLGVPVSR